MALSIAAASSNLPSSRAWVNSAIRSGATFEATLTTPAAPEHREILRRPLQNLLYLGDLSGCFLYRHYVGYVRGKFQGGLRLDVGTGAAGHVVEDYGFVGLAGDGLEILIHPPLGRFVVVGGHHQEGICLIQKADVGDGARDTVGAYANHHRQATGILAGAVVDVQFLLVGKGGSLSRSAQRHQEIYSSLHLPPDASAEAVEIYFSILERGEERRSATFEL